MRFVHSYSRATSHLIPTPQGDFAFISTPGSDAIEFFDNTENSDDSASFRYHPFNIENPLRTYELSRDQHREVILKALEKIDHHVFEKVVISRTKNVSITKTMAEWLSVYRTLCSRYPSACVNWFSQGNTMWMGATPELLVSKKENTWRTVSLAGTQPFKADISLDDHPWKDKEIREQGIVTAYIISTLQNAGAKQIVASDPYNLHAGPLVHIKSDITFDFDGDISHILKSLHPTPAVCGFPLKESLDFIRMHELHSRDMYAGYFGVQDAKGNAHYYVNLRCIHIQSDTLTLYAGGGIVAGSDPDKEWEETEKKMDVMLSVVQSV